MLVSLLLSAAFATAQPQPQRPPAAKAKARNAPVVLCVAGGHGPYDESWDSCLELGRNQARANCAVSGRDAVVEIQGREGKLQKRASCRALASDSECRAECGAWATRGRAPRP